MPPSTGHVSCHQLSPPGDSPSTGGPADEDLVFRGMLSSILPLSSKERKKD